MSENPASKIDIHSHYIPPAYLDWTRGEGARHGRKLVEEADGQLTLLADARSIPVPAGFFDVETRLADMDGQGVDCQVVSPPPFLLHYDLAPDLAAELATLLNDEIAALVAQPGGRFLPMGTLPMQDTDRALSELERITGVHGMRSIEIGASVNGLELDDPGFAEFWSAMETSKLLVFIHPVAPPGRERMNDYHLFNLIGFLAETTLAAARLIFSGTLDRHPGLRICLPHAGGMLPWIAGRFDHGFETIAACRKDCAAPPSTYIERLYYDTISHGAAQLEFRADKVGPERILMGTDYPFRIGDMKPVEAVMAASAIGASGQRRILGTNAARLIGLLQEQAA
ncbi:MAG TPA: amidohydrolase family protein [Afifellaceae bacterium]|nr:amidohydrolase family protein [Afifellaceae bacterium]